MAKDNRTWGAERIREELLKLGIKVAKSTIQTIREPATLPVPTKQTWATFLRNHAKDIWAVDFLQTYDLFFRAIFVFVVIELGSRRLFHFRVTRSPNDAWVAQQLREATPFGQGPCFLIRDNDNKFGHAFDRVAKGTGIEVLTTPYKAPKANAICERFLGSVRRECLDFFLILNERHLHKSMKQYQSLLQSRSPTPRNQAANPLSLGATAVQHGNDQRSPVLGGYITITADIRQVDPQSLALLDASQVNLLAAFCSLVVGHRIALPVGLDGIVPTQLLHKTPSTNLRAKGPAKSSLARLSCYHWTSGLRPKGMKHMVEAHPGRSPNGISGAKATDPCMDGIFGPDTTRPFLTLRLRWHLVIRVYSGHAMSLELPDWRIVCQGEDSGRLRVHLGSISAFLYR